MKVTNEKTENRQAYLKIEVEPAEVAAGMEKAYKRLVNRVNVPGFRRGKAPRPVFERFYGEHELFHEALDDIIPEAYNRAISEEKLEPIAQPELEMIQEEPVIFNAVVPLKPEITLGDYKTIDIKPEPIVIEEETIDKVVERLRQQNAVFEPVQREVKAMDLVTLDVESSLQDEPFINQSGVQYQVNPESQSPAPGFAGELIGMAKDAEKEFTLKFPEDYARTEAAGKEAKFKVKVAEIKEEKLPEVNDEFAKQVDPEYTTVAVLREKVRENLQMHADDQSKRAYEDKVIAAAAELSQVAYPPVMVEMEIDNLMERQFRFLQNSGQDIDLYLRSINKTPEEMRIELKPDAEKVVRESLVIDKIAREENITVTPEEIEQEIERVYANTPGDREKMKEVLNQERTRNSIENNLITRKTVEMLVGIARKKYNTDEPGQEAVTVTENEAEKPETDKTGEQAAEST